MIEIDMQIKMDEDEETPCPCCGKMHKIKLEEIAVLLGECDQCDMGIILEVLARQKGTMQ
jgi:hypothetical protein